MDRARRGLDDPQAAVGPLAKQRGDGVALQPDRLIQGRELGFGRGAPGVGALQRGLGFEALSGPGRDQVFAVGADPQRLLGRLMVGMELRQVRIGRGHRCGEGEPSGGLVGPRRFGLRGGGRQEGAVLAHVVQLPVEARADQPHALPAVGHEGLGNPHVVALLRLGDGGRDGDVGSQRGRRRFGQGLRQAHPRPRLGEIRGARKRLIDQSVQLRIAIGRPPAVRGPVRDRRGEGLARGVGRRGFRLGRRAQLRDGGAGRKGGGRDTGQHGEASDPLEGEGLHLCNLALNDTVRFRIVKRMRLRRQVKKVHLGFEKKGSYSCE